MSEVKPAAEPTAEKPNPLTPREDAYCREYLIDLNQTQAAIRAGYSKKTAAKIASVLMNHPRIKERILESMKQRAERLEISADSIIKELAIVAMARMGQFADWGAAGVCLKESTEVDTRAVQSIRESDEGALSIKLHDKVRALEIMGRHFGILGELSDQDKADAYMAALNAIHAKRLAARLKKV